MPEATPRDQDDDAHQGPATEPPPSSPAAGWTAVAEASTETDSPGSEPLLSRLRALATRLATRPHWRKALGHAAKTFHFPEIGATASAPVLLPPSAPVTATPEPLDPIQVRARVEAIMKMLPPRGDPAIPTNLQALGRLLADTPPTDDFEAADLLHDCFPRGTRNSNSRVLMAIARNLTRNFGRSGRLPITSGKAWTMIDPELFSDELAAQLAAISSFILNWQTTEKEFLILEFAEVELIEYLFENLHPRRHAVLLIKVMDFKVLSLRRMGLLRRVPARIRRRIHNAHGADPTALRDYVNDTVALLNHFIRPDCFPAVSAAARTARTELEKIAAHLAAPPATGSPQQPLAPAMPATPAAPLHPVMRGLGSAPLQPVSEPAPPRQLTPPASTPRRRFTQKQKTQAVMRLLQGEELEWVAISLGISPSLLSRWQDAFLNGGNAALSQQSAKAVAAKPRHDREPSVEELKDKLHALIQTVEQLSSQMTQTMALPAPKPEAEAEKPVLALPSPPPPRPKPGPPKNTRFAKNKKPRT